MKRDKPKQAHVPRFYVSAPLSGLDPINLPGDQAHHLAKVLRAQPGDPVVLFNGDGHEYLASIGEIKKSNVLLAIERSLQVVRESPLRLTLAQGIARGDRMDNAIAKAVELGVAELQPLFTARGKVRLTGERLEKKQDHWQRIAISAAEQSGRTVVPEVRTPMSLSEFLEPPLRGLGLVLDPGADNGLNATDHATEITLLVGPESGLTNEELEQAKRVGYTPLRFGPRILRTETAGPACLAALQTLWGDLG